MQVNGLFSSIGVGSSFLTGRESWEAYKVFVPGNISCRFCMAACPPFTGGINVDFLCTHPGVPSGIFWAIMVLDMQPARVSVLRLEEK